ncbi:MAG: diguanylate cyclase [Mesorhizobium sp.]|nr:GGDEF domain-containing protein [Mesorhizobium sp.]MBL8576114.1 diguanylate cyclase [Mesorhizobium sp.]
MEKLRPWLENFGFDSLKRAALLLVTVLAGVELLVVIYYWDLGRSRLESELAISAVIAVLVGLPVILYVVTQHSRLQRLTEKLAQLSSSDQMTGLLNRQTFVERLGVRLYKTGKGKSAGVLAYIDADHFKAINDRHGHAVGDKVIQIIATKIKAIARQNDLCGRLGGEEFGIFLPGVTLAEAGAIADRLRCEVNESESELGVPGLKMSVSIGIASHKPGATALDTMQAADRSLYAAKNGGRNAVVVELERYRFG